ncbi:hypothetical protein [Streptomyces sp. NPDC003943]
MSAGERPRRPSARPALPAPLVSFLGPAIELADLDEALGHARLVAQGPAGAGIRPLTAHTGSDQTTRRRG